MRLNLFLSLAGQLAPDRGFSSSRSYQMSTCIWYLYYESVQGGKKPWMLMYELILWMSRLKLTSIFLFEVWLPEGRCVRTKSYEVKIWLCRSIRQRLMIENSHLGIVIVMKANWNHVVLSHLWRWTTATIELIWIMAASRTRFRLPIRVKALYCDRLIDLQFSSTAFSEIFLLLFSVFPSQGLITMRKSSKFVNNLKMFPSIS